METQLNTESVNKKIKLDFKDSKYATGRRKKSIAKVWLKKGSGNIYVNGKKMVDYFKKQNLQMSIFRPLTIVKREKEFDVRCSVKGGGLTGQAGAIIHGIARALVAFEPELKITLKKEKLTTRDSRAVERKKYGRRKARRSFQFSKR
jgi:small subunit ribosomal protein S9|tara:strand:+ start:132 stop:572 length:441 start_codon:yes stop_codon:yes gene_type:complete